MTLSTPHPLTDRQFNGLAALAVVLLGFLAYANTFDGEFVWDDVSSVLLHQHVRDPSKFLDLFTEDQHAFAGGQGNFYRPLVSISFMGDYILSTIGRERPDPQTVPDDLGTFFFHFSNTLWHVTAAVLLLVLMHRAGAPRLVRAAVPLLYVLHPLHTEAVAYISGRADSMSAVFIFAALVCSTWNETPRRRIAGLFLMLLFFACGLLSKESSFIFPVLLALSILLLPPPESVIGPPPKLNRWLPLAGALLVLGVYVGLRTTVLNFGSDSTPPDSTFTERIIESLQALALYAALIVAPIGLHMERTLEAIPAYAAPAGFAILAGLITLIVLCLRRKRSRAAFGLAWFLVTWLPISGIFPLNAPMAEHWMYVPLAGLLWAFGEILNDLLGSRTPAGLRVPVQGTAMLVLLLWAGTLLALTVNRNQHWHSNESIYTATLRESPDSTRVHFNLAVTYQDILDNPSGARRHYEAVTLAYEKRKRENPALRDLFWNEEMESHLSMGDIYLDQRRIAEAYNHYRILVEVLANEQGDANRALFAAAAFGMGRCLLAVNDREAARRQFDLAIRTMPQLRPQIEDLLARDNPFG